MGSLLEGNIVPGVEFPDENNDTPSRGPRGLDVGGANLKTRPSEEVESRFRFFETALGGGMVLNNSGKLRLLIILLWFRERKIEVVGRRRKIQMFGD